MGLYRMSQLCMILETIEGTAGTLVTGNQLPVLAEARVANTIAMIERDIMRNTLTNLQAMPGLKSGAVPFKMELAGPSPASAFPSTKAAFDLPLRACGMKSETLVRVPIESSWNSGTSVRDGATCGTSAPMTGMVWGDYVPGDTHMFILVLTGTLGDSDTILITNPDATTASIDAAGADVPAVGYRPCDRIISRFSVDSVTNGPINDGEVLLGGTSGAVAILRKASSGAGAQTLQVELSPYSAVFTTGETITVPGTTKSAVVAATPNFTQSQNPSVTLGVNHASVIRNAIRGARGNWGAELVNGERGLLTFNFQGCAIQPVDTVNFITPSVSQLVPANVIGGRFSIDSTFLPVFSSLTIDMGNELALRDDPQDSTGSGYKSCRIVGRKPTGSIDPETVKRAVYDVHGKAWDKTPFRLAARIVSASAGNSFEIRGRKVLAGNIEEASRSGILTTNVPLSFHGDPAQGTDSNYGGDELMLLEW